MAQSPPTTEEMLAGMVTKEVEPGVYRVVNDGVRDLTYHPERTDHTWLGLSFPAIVAGADGGAWVLHKDGFYRVGVRHAPFDEGEDGGWHFPAHPLDVEVTPDGTVWATMEMGADPEAGLMRSGVYVWSLDGDEWAFQAPGMLVGPVEVTSDGSVWARWFDGRENGDSVVFGYLGADGWTVVGERAFMGDMHVSDAGDVWADGGVTAMSPRAHRFVDGAWQTYHDRLGSSDLGLGPDGTLWGIGGDGFVRFDGAEWMAFEPPDWMLAEAGWRLVEDE